MRNWAEVDELVLELGHIRFLRQMCGADREPALADIDAAITSAVRAVAATLDDDHVEVVREARLLLVQARSAVECAQLAAEHAVESRHQSALMRRHAREQAERARTARAEIEKTHRRARRPGKDDPK